MGLTLIGLIAIVLAVLVLGYTNRAAVSRAFVRRSLEQQASTAAAKEPEPENVSRPNCGIPTAPSDVAAQCLAEQKSAFLADKEMFFGIKGYDRTRNNLFNRYDGRPFFPRTRHVTMVSVGAHFGDIMDRYGALGRGPRLDDRIILVEPHPYTIQRLKGRIRLDHRLLLMQAAAHNFDGEAWFEYEKKNIFPEPGGSGKVVKNFYPENVTLAQEHGQGAKIRVVTMDTLMTKIKGPIDFIYMDADVHEPFIFEGMKETLKRTRLLIFSCHGKWSASGSSSTVFDVVEKYIKPAGMTVALLGEKRNILLDKEVVPPELVAELPDWGFCIASHVAPPVTRKVEEHTKLMVGGEAWEGACGKYFANLAAGSCNGGLLDTLEGVESPELLELMAQKRDGANAPPVFY